MSAANQRNVVDHIERDTLTASEAIEAAQSGSRLVNLTVQMTADAQDLLNRYAREERVNQGEAAANLIMDGLDQLGYRD